MRTLTQYFIPVIVVGLFVLFQSVFVVYEGQKAVVLRFGKVVTDQSNKTLVYGPGIHFYLPFIDNEYIMDGRMQIRDVESDKIQNKEQIYLKVDFFLKWKVDDFEKFFLVNTLGGGRSWDIAKKNAEKLIDQNVKNAVLIEFGQRSLSELIMEGREEVMSLFAGSLNESLEKLGITLIDFRLKRIDLPDEVSERVYNRMRTEREKVAAKHRALGKERAEKIRAQTDAEKKIILSQAQRDALEMMGQGDAVASDIYAQAYNKDPDFYKYIRKLEMYEKSFSDKTDMLVLRADKDLFYQLYPSKK